MSPGPCGPNLPCGEERLLSSARSTVNTAWGLPEPEALALEAELQHGVLGKKNQLEAVMANMQKRAPELDD